MTNLNFRHDPILANRHKWMRIWQRKRWAYWTSTWTKPTEEFYRQFPMTIKDCYERKDQR